MPAAYTVATDRRLSTTLVSSQTLATEADPTRLVLYDEDTRQLQNGLKPAIQIRTETTFYGRVLSLPVTRLLGLL